MRSRSFPATAEQLVKPGSPLAARARAVPSFFSGWIGSDHDRIRLLDNMRAKKSVIEDTRLVFGKSNNPVWLLPFTTRELLANAWIDGDRRVDAAEPAVATVAKSAKAGSASDIDFINKIAKHFGTKTTGVVLDDSYNGCKKPLGKKMNLFLKHASIEKIPACIERRADAAGLRQISLADNRIERIENLDNLPELRWLGLSGNRIGKIENLDPLKSLKTLHLAGNKIEKIEHLDNLDFDKMVDIDLRKNKFTYEQCREFFRSMPERTSEFSIHVDCGSPT